MTVVAKTIDHATLRSLAESGQAPDAEAVSTPTGWKVTVHLGRERRQLIAQRSRETRMFKRMESVVNYLTSVGIAQFKVDASKFSPSEISHGTRPDRSEALKNAHQAAEYNRWFDEQVQEAIDDPSPAIPHSEVKLHFDKKKAALIENLTKEDMSRLTELRMARKVRR